MDDALAKSLRKMKTFVVHYQHDGKTWGLDLPARDLSDAKARLARLAWANVEGELKLKVPASFGPFVLFAVWLRNALHRLIARDTI